MIENIKIYSKIATKSFFKWLLLVGLGIGLSIIVFIILLFQNIINNENSTIFNLYKTNWTAFILIIGTPIFIILYIIIVNKHFIQNAINQVWKNKAEGFATEKIKLIVDKLVAKNETLNSISNESVLRLKLLEENRTNPDTSKIKRKIVDYIIKKIKLDEIDYSDKELRLSDIVANKVNSFISESAEPSLLFFWIILVLQIVLFIIAQFL